MIMDFCQVDYVFLYCLSAVFFRVVPFVSTVMIGVVGACHCYCLNEGNLVLSIRLVLVYAYVDSRLSTDILEKKFQYSAYLGMSVFLGLYAFGL